MKKSSVLLLGFLTILGPKLFSQQKPVQLNQLIRLDEAQSTIYLTDFIPQKEKIRSVNIVGSGYSVDWNFGADTCVVNIDNHSSAMARINVYTVDGENVSIPLKRNTKSWRDFYFPDKLGQFQSVQVKGTFNAWNSQSFSLARKGNEWIGKCKVGAGHHQYVFVLDGKKEVRDPSRDSISNGMGGFNSVFSIENKEYKLWSSFYTDSKVVLKTNAVLLDKKGNNLISILCLFDNKAFRVNAITKNNETWIEIPLLPVYGKKGLSYLRCWVFSEEGISNDVLIPLIDGKVMRDMNKTVQLNDPRTMIIYNPMIDRFNDGNKDNNRKLNRSDVLPKVDFQGGDIAGITQKIKDGYFSRLGVNTLWISPIIKNPDGPWGQWNKPATKFSGYHGYWPISSTQMDSRFCSPSEFSEFLDLAHRNGMKVLVDYVAHHIHQEHPLYKQKPDWYTPLILPDGSKNTERWDDYRLTTWFDDFMPTFNFFKPEVVNAMTDSAVWWFKNYPIDGFRHDATKHIPDVFWRTLTYKLKTQIIEKQGRGLYQIGETYGSPELIGSYLGSGLLDAQFDFNLYDAAVECFRKPGSFSSLLNVVNDSRRFYGSHHMMGNITGNQDRARFISLADGSLKEGENYKQAGWDRNIQIQDPLAYNRLQQLMTFMISLPGIPVIYYGDEIGMPGANDPDCRRMMRFGDKQLTQEESANKSVFEFLLTLRKKQTELNYGGTTVTPVNTDVMLVERSYFNSKTLFYFNRGNQIWNTEAIKTSMANSKEVWLVANNKVEKVAAEKLVQLNPESCLIIIQTN